MNIDYTYIPAHMQDAIRRYIEHGIIPGSFLLAVLENNLVQAFGKADYVNTQRMHDWAQFLHHLPTNMWGSWAIVLAYAKSKQESKS